MTAFATYYDTNITETERNIPETCIARSFTYRNNLSLLPRHVAKKHHVRRSNPVFLKKLTIVTVID